MALAHFGLGLRVRNVVFMGMGEPLDNVDAVVRAVRCLSQFPAGLAVPLKNITISTVRLPSQWCTPSPHSGVWPSRL